jgi:hypothetical protein
LEEFQVTTKHKEINGKQKNLTIIKNMIGWIAPIALPHLALAGAIRMGHPIREVAPPSIK